MTPAALPRPVSILGTACTLHRLPVGGYAVTRDDTGALVAQHPQRLAAVGNAATVLAGAPGCIRGLSAGECQDGDCRGCCS